MLKIAVGNIKNWIFVTGTIRSGTTFVGTILSFPLEVDYIHEPFNPQCGLPGMNRWYPYVRASLDTPDMQQFHEQTKAIFSYDFILRNKIPQNDSLTRKITKQLIGSRGPFYLRLAKINPFHTAAVIKDPIGNLLTEYLYIQFSVKPVIIIKHPLSLIASLKRVNWWPHLGEINDQPCFVQDYFANELDFIQNTNSDPVLAAAAYWRAVHQVFLSQSSHYRDWQLITHEELSASPQSTFKNLYSKLDLPWSKSVEKKIIKLTDRNQSTQARRGRVQDFNRNSADIFKVRRQSLSREERKAIFEIVEDVALQIYSRESFDID
ncbi:MAG: hypothetical protein SWJ54_21840 [Cyanobacteriota bacterium]|nr:hypothetical protein [Cyanobacteriota bacterium]